MGVDMGLSGIYSAPRSTEWCIMRTGQLLINSICLIQHLNVCDSFLSRGVGLLGKSGLPENTGIWLTPCRGVHTCFMRFEIDILYLDKAGMVLGLQTGVAPSRFPKAPKGTYSIVEVQSGWLDAEACQVGAASAFTSHPPSA